ncbi:MAG: putative rane protein [Frankiales bacterium]|nr:putative rane protein [Frankiales bacterium]
MSVFDVLAQPVALVMEGIHTGLTKIGIPSGSGWAWGLSIVLLTITVRILLFPLFVKQIKSQRRMQELAPKIKELQAKHKGDRETLNTELMKVYKDHGTNPISGCLPLILQLPIFFALFRVMNEFKPHFKNVDGRSVAFFKGKYGLSDTLIEQAAKAKVFGAPISAAFNSKGAFLTTLGGHATTVKVVATIMIVTMGATTFLTQRQMMARNGAPTDPQQAQVQKIMLYVLPFSFAIFGFSFPIGVLLYWLTTNVWSMGQQRWVIARMPPVVPGGGGAGKPKDPKGKGGPSATDKPDKPDKPGRPDKPTSSPGDEPTDPPTDSAASTKVVATGGQPSRPGAGRPQNRGNSGSRKNKSRKGGRR